MIPARVRQESGLIAASVMVVGLVVVLLGSVRIRPTVFTSSAPGAAVFKENVQGTVDLFDRSVVHTIDISVSDVEYQEMVTKFQDGGEKAWIEADAIIDGTVVGSVGIRLKGNSTLMSLRRSVGGGAGFPGGGPGGVPSGFPGMPPGGVPSGFPGVPPEGLPPLPEGMPAPEGMSAPPASSAGASGGGADGGRPSMSNVSFEDPSSLPMVVSFHKFLHGRGYQGIGELAVRPVVGQGGATLNEALALQLIADSGQPSQRYTWVQFSFRGGAKATRLVVENPDAAYADRLGLGEGVLYKSRSTNEFAYKGEEPTAYADDFAQLSKEGSRDLAPVIRLLEFVFTSTDEDFDARLSSYVDVEAFARYCATHELLNNFDDMSGPGRNFLLWYDEADARFTVITWDMNLAITGMGGMGGMGSKGRMGAPAGGAPRTGAEAREGTPRGGRPSGGAGPGIGGQRPGGPGGGGGRGGNRLKERFLASAAFADLREAAKAELRAAWFDGHGEAVATELAALVPTNAVLTREKVDGELISLVSAFSAL